MKPALNTMYALNGRPIHPPERLIKAGLIISLYDMRSEQAMYEEITPNLLDRRLLDMDRIDTSLEASSTNPGVRQYKKVSGAEVPSSLSWTYVLDKRHELLVDIQVTQPGRTAEREAA